MSYSVLTDYVRLSPNCTKPRNQKINAIVIHHVAGKATAEALGSIFAAESRQASSNYGVGIDGRIGCYVEEENRSWCSSNREIDHRAITIEVSNCSGAPDWKVSDQSLEATITLCYDICRRYGFELNYTGDKSGNLHKHEWYAATACPGPYLGAKFAYIAEEVNRRLKAQSAPQTEENIYRVQVGAFSQRANAEAQLAQVKALGFADAFIAEVDDKLFRVQLGAFREKANADAMLKKVQEKGLKGFVTKLSGKPVSSAAPVKTVDELAREVIAGKHGTGEARKKSLGSRYAEVQKRVNELMKG